MAKVQNVTTDCSEDFSEILQPDSCFVLNDNFKERETICKRERSFFCRFGTDDDKGDFISIPNLSIGPQNNAESNNWRSIAAGTITSTIVLIIAILVYFILRRRLSKKKPTIHKSQNSCPVQDLDELHINNETFQTAVNHEIDDGNNSPPYEILNRYPAVISSSYDCLNVTFTQESENVYINTNNSATSMSDFTGTDSKFHEQNERVKQKKQNASKVEFNIDNESSDGAAYHAIDNRHLSPQYEKLNNVPAVNATT
ncbi:uncharacterized protein LOC143053713 [Mytilus galloprovincialis]|uniref:uncharacterized protein LOC143053713 n=1 Tax=Mytilus galloprovincialis TaxID=29158 RepID=UPI003F7BE6B1